jgi:hypothetical protein
MSHHRSIALTAMTIAIALAATSAGGNRAAPSCFGQPADIVGTNGDDRLGGTANDDVILLRGVMTSSTRTRATTGSAGAAGTTSCTAGMARTAPTVKTATTSSTDAAGWPTSLSGVRATTRSSAAPSSRAARATMT